MAVSTTSGFGMEQICSIRACRTLARSGGSGDEGLHRRPPSTSDCKCSLHRPLPTSVPSSPILPLPLFLFAPSSSSRKQSGFGFNGGRSRCFNYWQEFQKCYAQADFPSECVLQKDDYIECLHHGKEIARAQQVKEHYIQHEMRRAKEQREKGELRATGGIMNLGLIGGGSDESGGEDKKAPSGGNGGDKGSEGKEGK